MRLLLLLLLQFILRHNGNRGTNQSLPKCSMRQAISCSIPLLFIYKRLKRCCLIAGRQLLGAPDTAGSPTGKPVQPVLKPQIQNKECLDNGFNYGFKLDAPVAEGTTYTITFVNGNAVFYVDGVECVDKLCSGTKVDFFVKAGLSPADGSEFSAKVKYYSSTPDATCSPACPSPNLGVQCVSCNATLYFEWTTSADSTAIAVKGGQGYNYYDYGSGATTDKYLHSPVTQLEPEKPRDISHISFCFNKFCAKRKYFVYVGDYCTAPKVFYSINTGASGDTQVTGKTCDEVEEVCDA